MSQWLCCEIYRPYIILMLCSFSAGDGGDCKRNLNKRKSFTFFLAIINHVMSNKNGNFNPWDPEHHSCHHNDHLPANLSDILGGGRFILDTVAPEMPSRELLPIIVVVIFILFSSCPHLIIITNLRMTEQPTLMEAPTPSHIAEEWYLGVGNVLILDHQLVDN